MNRQILNSINNKNKKPILNYLHGVIIYTDKNKNKNDSINKITKNKNNKIIQSEITIEEELLMFYY